MIIGALVAGALSMLYIVGGLLHMRQLVMSAMVDDLLFALDDVQAGRERLRTRIMTAGAALTFASGLSLMVLSRWTLLIFVCNAALQGAFLIWAACTSPPEDALEREGRAATVRAYVLYLAALAFVVYLDRAQAWRAWLEPAVLELVAITVVTLTTAWIIQRRPGGSSKAANGWWSPPPDEEDPPIPERLRLAPEFRCLPLWDDDTGAMVDVTCLGLSEPLTDRIRAWDGDYQGLYRNDDPLASRFEAVEEERAWVAEGDAIADALRREWTGPLVVRISGLDQILRDLRDPYNPQNRTPEERLRRAGERCGVAEVQDAIARLDALGKERDATPAWDGDTSDDISEAQTRLLRVLTHAPPRYGEDIAAGLNSEEWQTRAYIALALADRRDRAALGAMKRALDRESDPHQREMLAAAIARLDAS